MTDNICQIAVCILGLIAIILVSRKNRWGFVVGLISQPFWLVTTYTHQQWGIFILAVAYAFTWGYGVYQWFFATNTPVDPEIKALRKRVSDLELLLEDRSRS